MQERALSPGTRIVAGVVGVAIACVALFVALSQVRAGWGGDLRAWLAAIAVLVVAIIAVRLVRAALRGTIRVRGAGGSRT